MEEEQEVQYLNVNQIIQVEPEIEAKDIGEKTGLLEANILQQPKGKKHKTKKMLKVELMIRENLGSKIGLVRKIIK